MFATKYWQKAMVSRLQGFSGLVTLLKRTTTANKGIFDYVPDGELASGLPYVVICDHDEEDESLQDKEGNDTEGENLRHITSTIHVFSKKPSYGEAYDVAEQVDAALHNCEAELTAILEAQGADWACRDVHYIRSKGNPATSDFRHYYLTYEAYLERL